METWLAEKVLLLVPFWISLGIHEWAHAAAAMRLGDDTAYRLGRMTMNPLAHLDPIGTVLLPVLGVPFGWAKPVPIQPTRFRSNVSMRTGVMLTAAAGPASNLVLAMLLFSLDRFPVEPRLHQLIARAAWLNVSLAVFNMLPIPPLDGSRVVEGLLSYSQRTQWERAAKWIGGALLFVVASFFLLDCGK